MRDRSCCQRLGLSQVVFLPTPFTLLIASYCGASLSVGVSIQASVFLACFALHAWLLRDATKVSHSTVGVPALVLFDALLLLTLAHTLQLAPLCRETAPRLTDLTSFGIGARQPQPHAVDPPAASEVATGAGCGGRSVAPRAY